MERKKEKFAILTLIITILLFILSYFASSISDIQKIIVIAIVIIIIFLAIFISNLLSKINEFIENQEMLNKKHEERFKIYKRLIKLEEEVKNLTK